MYLISGILCELQMLAFLENEKNSPKIKSAKIPINRNDSLVKRNCTKNKVLTSFLDKNLLHPYAIITQYMYMVLYENCWQYPVLV